MEKCRLKAGCRPAGTSAGREAACTPAGTSSAGLVSLATFSKQLAGQRERLCGTGILSRLQARGTRNRRGERNSTSAAEVGYVIHCHNLPSVIALRHKVPSVINCHNLPSVIALRHRELECNLILRFERHRINGRRMRK